MIEILFFIAAVLSALATALAVFTPRRPLLVGWLGWAIGLVPCEVPRAAITLNVLLLGLFAVLGTLQSVLGIAAVALLGAAIVGDLVLVRRTLATALAIDRALDDGLGATFQADVGPDVAPSGQGSAAVREAFAPFLPRRRDVVHIADVAYGDDERNKLDLYLHRSRPSDCPVLLYIHGGAWTSGRKDQQGLPATYHFASRGWLCIQPNYRLCPDATFPDQLVDIKRAIAWVHQHAHEHGGDPRQIFVTGGSAGAHLSALAALTMNDPAFQPGFKDLETSVVAAIPLYGDYDWLDSHEERANRGLDRSKYLAEKILKCTTDVDRERWELGSPIYHVRPDAPPFFVVHGARDTMLQVEDARHFVAALRSVSRSPVAYAELPGAQHSFDGFQSVRCSAVVTGMERFTSWVRTTYLQVA